MNYFVEIIEEKDRKRTLHKKLVTMPDDEKYDSFMAKYVKNFNNTRGEEPLVEGEDLLSVFRHGNDTTTRLMTAKPLAASEYRILKKYL